MTSTPPRFLGIPRWILAWISFPLSGLVAWLALGPIVSPGFSLAAGILVGLGVGAAGAWALRVTIAPWALASALGLGAGSLLGALVAPVLAPPLGGLVAAALAGAGIGLAQATLRPPLPRLAWAGLVLVAWIGAWAVSLAVAIDAEQGFAVFGASGALLFTVVIAVSATLVARRRPSAVTA